MNFLYGVDFIYYLLFYFCKILNINFGIITGLSVFFLYYNSYKIVKHFANELNIFIDKSNYYYILIAIISSVSFVTVFGISRNVTAIAFFSFSVLFFLKNKKIFGFIFSILSVFTHIGMLIYIIIVLFSIYFGKHIFEKKIVRRSVLLFFVLFGLNSILFMQQVLPKLLSFPFFSSFQYYTQYLDPSKTQNIFTFQLNYADIIMFISTALFGLYTLWFVNSKSVLLRIYYFIYIWLLISLGFSQMFTQRTFLFLILFQGVAAIQAFVETNRNVVVGAKILILLVFICFILNIYGYRDIWTFSL